MTIGIFGGSFNPIHLGHIAIAQAALDKVDIDEVWFVVSPQNPFKKHEDLLADELRLEMVREAVKGHEGMLCSDYEYHLPRPSYMWNTLQALGKDYPAHTFALIIGADNWVSFPRWRNSSDILAHHKIVVYPRQGYDINPNGLPQGVICLDVPLLDISATEIREHLSKGLSTEDFLPKGVAEMLIKNNF